MRGLLIALIVVGTVAPAAAETELVVLGPVGAHKPDVAAVKAALGKAGVGAVSPRAIDAACAGDPGCLATTGTELGARRVLAVSLAGKAGKTTKLTVMFVDVGAKLLLGTRDVELTTRKLAKELPVALKKFVAETATEKAKGLFAEGNQHYNLGEFAKALDSYKLAYRVKPLPAFQFNIAQCHRKLGQYKEAIAMYQAYLVDVPDAPNKAMVDSLIAESKKAIDDRIAEEGRIERERLLTERKKAEEARKAKEAEAAALAEKAKIEQERAKAEQARIAAEREREKTYNRHPARKWMMLTGALGLAAIGAGAYYWIQARDAQSTFDRTGCGDRSQLLGPDALATCRSERERGDQAALFGNVLVGSGAAVLVTSTIVFVLDPGNIERPNTASPRVAVTPSSVKVVFSW